MIKNSFGILVIVNRNVEYLDYKNCKCRDKLVDKLVKEYSENIDGDELLYNRTLNFSDGSKKLVTVWTKRLHACERPFWVLSENCIVNRFWSYCLWDIKGRNIKKTWRSNQKITKPCIFKDCHLGKGSSECHNP